MTGRFLTLLFVSVFLLACAPEVRVIRPSFEEYRKLSKQTGGDRPIPLDDTPRKEARAKPDPATAAGWGIVLESFEGKSAASSARRLVKRLAKESGIPNLHTAELSGKLLVYRGPYPAADVDEARNELRQTRMLVVDGARRYEHVTIAPLSEAAAGGADSLDLRPQFGQGYYALQVAAFDAAYGKDFRQAAEDYAAGLRDRGEEAYYLHTRNFSQVLVGLFTESDFEDQAVRMPDGSVFKKQAYGPRVREAQTRFPRNLFNGYTVVQKPRGGEGGGSGGSREQPSFLVPLRDLPPGPLVGG